MLALIVVLSFLFVVIISFRQANTRMVSPNSSPFRRQMALQPSFPAFRTFSNSTTLSRIDQTLVFKGLNAAMALLPDARSCDGHILSITNGSRATPTPPLVITTTGSQNIEGKAICSLPHAEQSVTLVSDGLNWKILSQFIPSDCRPWKFSAGSVSYVKVAAGPTPELTVFHEISSN